MCSNVFELMRLARAVQLAAGLTSFSRRLTLLINPQITMGREELAVSCLNRHSNTTYDQESSCYDCLLVRRDLFTRGDRNHRNQQIDKNPPAFDTKNMDTVGQAGGRLLLYANGGWLKRTPIPPEYARWGSFNELIEKNNDALHEITEKAAKAAPKETSKDKVEKAASADLQKVGDFYASGMDREKNQRGTSEATCRMNSNTSTR